MEPKIFIGWDAREHLGWQVCAASLQRHASYPVQVQPISRPELIGRGLYHRPQRLIDGVQHDEISHAPVSTDFSLARFWVPLLAGSTGWAMFVDCDFMFRSDVRRLFERCDPRYAAMVVPHQHVPVETEKMDGQVQTVYPRKNWSSLVLWNMAHAGTRRLTTYLLNNATGRDLHRFHWLKDEEIGFLPESWNWLDGHSDPAMAVDAVHFTRGTPDMPGWEHTRYAAEWNRYAQALVGSRIGALA